MLHPLAQILWHSVGMGDGCVTLQRALFHIAAQRLCGCAAGQHRFQRVVVAQLVQLEAAALADEYFVSRKLYPNVDFYSGIIYRALGIPTDMFTVMFAIGRLPGWIAQWKEMRENKEPIGRPRQIYTGYSLRDFKEVEKR